MAHVSEVSDESFFNVPGDYAVFSCLQLKNDNVKEYMNRWTSLLTQLGDVNHSVVDYERKGKLFWEQIQQASIMVHYKPPIELEVIQKGLSQPDFDDLWQIAKQLVRVAK